MLPSRAARLWVLVAVATAIEAGLTFFVPDILTGPPAINGNARGTALVMLLAGAPALTACASLGGRGEWRAAIVGLGVLGYLVYNDLMLLFATPFNRLFLVDVIAFSLTLFTAIAAIATVDGDAVSRRLERLPVRGLATYAWVVCGLNVVAWLGSVVPAVLAERPGSFLDGTGIATNPVYVQDLSFWLPGAMLVAWLLWHRRPIAYPLFGAWLVYGLFESVGVAVDQWFGSQADPAAAPNATLAIGLFLVLALIGVVPLAVYFRAARGEERLRAVNAIAP
jgi:uncharacterized membrane protein